MDQPPDELRSAALRLGQISPRRALGTPVLVALTDAADAVLITLTPFDPAEAEPLEAELTQRLHDALTSDTEPTSA